jgi:ribosomal protein L40E
MASFSLVICKSCGAVNATTSKIGLVDNCHQCHRDPHIHYGDIDSATPSPTETQANLLLEEISCICFTCYAVNDYSANVCHRCGRCPRLTYPKIGQAPYTGGGEEVETMD